MTEYPTRARSRSCEEHRDLMKNLIAAIVLAAMTIPAYADDRGPFGFDFGPLLDFFNLLDRSWLGTVDDTRYKPNAWNGVWPNLSRDSVWNNRTALYHERGGVIQEHVERWRELARSGADVEILGPCYSACTLVVAYIAKERLCFGVFGSLQFHLAWNRETGKPSLDASLWMLKQYPREIHDWIMERGGVASMTIPTFWELRAPNLWRMGYRKCERGRSMVVDTENTCHSGTEIVPCSPDYDPNYKAK
jgi:hypothetical protein